MAHTTPLRLACEHYGSSQGGNTDGIERINRSSATSPEKAPHNAGASLMTTTYSPTSHEITLEGRVFSTGQSESLTQSPEEESLVENALTGSLQNLSLGCTARDQSGSPAAQ